MNFRTIAIASAATAAFAVPGIAQAYYGQATGSVNMRTCASVSCPAITVVPRGSQVWINGSTGSWYQVSYAGVTGYVAAGYVATQYAQAPQYQQPQVTLGFQFGNRPPAPRGGYYRNPYWDEQNNAWYDGRNWYYNNSWYDAPPNAGFSFGFNFGSGY